MAFWGVEVKPGKPFTHPAHSTRGRLHVSQATLGLGTETKKKSVVQCNVGNKSPVFLCSLFPELAESCQLNLEFEEVDEVLFSVIGPRSVHLTGYYLGLNRQYKLDDESESYGVDIVDTENEKSDGVEDEYEDSFIDDDDLQVNPQSPLSDSADEDSLLRDRKKGAMVKHRRLRKKYQSAQTDDEDPMDSECQDVTTISGKPGAQEKAEKDRGLKRKPHEDNSLPLVENDPKQKKKVKKPKEEKVVKSKEDDFFAGEILLWDKSLKNQKKFDQSSQNTALTNGDDKKSETNGGSLPSDDLIDGIVANAGDKENKLANETTAREADEPFNDVNTENQTQPDEKQENVEEENKLHTSLPSDGLNNGNVVKTQEKKNKQANKTKVLVADKPSKNVNMGDQTQSDEARCLKLAQESLIKSDEDVKQANDEKGKKTKTKKRKQKPAKEENALAADLSLENISREDQAQPDGAKGENIEQGNLLKSENNQKQANDEGDDLIHGIVANTGEEKNKHTNETEVLGADKPINNVNTEDQTQSDEARCVKLAQESLLKSDEDEKQAKDEGKKAKTRKRKQKPGKEENALGADPSLENISIEDPAQPDEARCENIEQGSLLKSEDSQKQANDEGVKLLQSDESVHEKVTKPVKRKKKIAKVEKVVEIDNSSGNINKEDQAQQKEASSERNENTVEDTMLKIEEKPKQSNNGNTAVVLGPETVPEPKKKRKKAGKDKALEEVEATNIELVVEDKAIGDEHTINVDAGNENHNVKKKGKKTALNTKTTVGESKKVLRSRK